MLYNQAIFSRLNGGTATANDYTSQTAYGVRASTETGLLHSSDSALANLAALYVNTYKTPEFRFEQIDFPLMSMNATNRATLLNLDIGSLVQIAFKPNNIAPAINKYAQVIGVKHETDYSTKHIMSLLFQTIDIAVFVLDSPVFGLLDSNILSY